MATSINSYSVRLGMDAAGFVDATKLSRSEARALIKDIEAARDPFEKFEANQQRLQKALESGAISQQVYNRLLDEQRKLMPQVDESVTQVDDSVIGLGTAFGVAAGAISSVLAAGTAFVIGVRAIQNAIDDAADAASRLGLSFNELTSLEFAFKEGGGLDGATVQASIKKLQINMAKAVDGDKTLRDAFGRLGLDAGQLIGMGPQQAVLAIAEKMQGVGTHAERLQIAMDLFGKAGADLASSLGNGASSLSEAIEFQQRWNSLTDEQVAAVGANNDAWDRISVIVEGISTKVAAEFAPAMLIIAERVLGAADSFEDVDKLVGQTVNKIVVMGAAIGDVADILAGITTGTGLGEAFSFEKAEGMVEALNKKRVEMEIKAEQDKLARDMARQTLLAQDAEKQEQDRWAKQVDRFEQQMRREDEAKRRQFADAYKNAEKFFEEERKKQQALHAEVAKGPGAGIEVGSSEAAKFFAEQANAALAATMQQAGTPTEEQMLEKTQQLLAEQQAQTAKTDEMVFKLQTLIDATKENGFKRIR